MTILVGVLCKDGAIIGSDSAVSSTAGQSLTVEHPGKKIEVIRNEVIVAGSGAKGMGQRFTDIVTNAWTKKELSSMNSISVGRTLSQRAVKDFQQTGISPGQYTALTAFPNGQKAQLCEFDPQFQPELKDEDSWYVSLGSGQLVADTLLGFARRVFWRDGPPTTEDGIFAAIWVLTLTIEMCPAAVSGPIQMAVLRGGKTPNAKELSGDEIASHQSQARSLMEYFGKYKEVALTGPREATPKLAPY